MNKFIFLILSVVSVNLSWAAYDVCPSPMTLQGRDCVYSAGNMTAANFRCSSLRGKFGDLDCTASAGKSCEDWAVSTCTDSKKTCDFLKDPRNLRTYKGEKLQEAQRALEYCRNASFTIPDPQKEPTPVQLTDEERRASISKSQGHIGSSEENLQLPVIPGFLDTMPAPYKGCQARKDNESEKYTQVSSLITPLVNKNTNYRIRKLNGTFEIKMKFLLNFEGNPADRDEVESKIANGRSCVEQFYWRHGIKLNLEFSFDSDSWSEWATSDVANVKISKYSKVINSAHWSLISGSNNNEEISPLGLCGTMVHEIGHRMGLPDRYYDANVPDREIVKDDIAVMNSGNWAIQQAYFTDDDLRLLTDPICKYKHNPNQLPLPVPSSIPSPTP